MEFRHVLRGLLLYVPVLCWSMPSSAQTALVDLGVGKGNGINNSGQVALDQGIWSNGTLTPIPALPGGTAPAAALAINSSGQVAGSAIQGTTFTGQPASHAILYSGSTLTDINALFTLGMQSENYGLATGINTSGTVVGYGIENSHDSIVYSFTYSNGVLTLLPQPCISNSAPGCGNGALNQAYGINDSGQITGFYIDWVSTSTARAYLLSNGTYTDFGPGKGYAINVNGQVTGTLNTATGSAAFLASGTSATSIGTLPGGQSSIGYAINSTGQIVGSSDFTGSTNTHAFFFNGVMMDLNSMIGVSDPLKPYVTLTDARGINDSRLIVVNGVDSRTNLTHAYLIQGPWINISPGPLSFASIAVGSTSATQTVTLTNASTNAVPLGGISASSNFLQTNDCGASLAPAAHCTVTVSFVPTTAGALNGGLTVVADSATEVIALSGVGLINASLTASATALNVGDSLTLTWTASAGSTCTANSSTGTFKDSIPASGSKVVTETAAGTDLYGIYCTAPGAPDVRANAPTVTWSWPPVTVAISASPMTITAGGSTTLTWSSTNATTCSASGGGGGDNWGGTIATSGSQSATEANALAVSSTTLTFTVSCSSTTSGLSSQASIKVTENSSGGGGGGGSGMSSGGGGGGAFDGLSLFALLGALGASIRARGCFTPTRSGLESEH